MCTPQTSHSGPWRLRQNIPIRPEICEFTVARTESVRKLIAAIVCLDAWVDTPTIVWKFSALAVSAIYHTHGLLPQYAPSARARWRCIRIRQIQGVNRVCNARKRNNYKENTIGEWFVPSGAPRQGECAQAPSFSWHFATLRQCGRFNCEKKCSVGVCSVGLNISPTGPGRGPGPGPGLGPPARGLPGEAAQKGRPKSERPKPKVPCPKSRAHIWFWAAAKL
jgi:hypothetical protein